jgi:Domain of unknown function (DUF1841)
MFSPSQHDVRAFFCDTYERQRGGLPLSPIQVQAADWIADHAEYHADLADPAGAQAAVYAVDDGKTNPFLHLSMHLTLDEQTAIDQPRGIRPAIELLAARLGSRHEAHHAAMECLGDMLWTSQRSGLPPDGEHYLACIRRRATR